ncbi:F-box/kelch-repeat protein At3g23880-like [Corylus avellana]|uniref:F-box/kelch-repeat protein At3g23880-like n=1 Tax=Corylus avellana TaxID=13451 RepID=UPI001E224877|nr:F-box/kelch-repeat protein At3g23880-like [Corylus avellana]
MLEQLPHDLQIEILVRLPVKSLLTFQCVSKSFKSLIRSTAFISTHSESTINYAHLVKGRLNRTGNKVEEMGVGIELHQFDDSFREFQRIECPSDTKLDYFEEILDCRGLLLITEEFLLRGDLSESFILWNPAVRMSMTLPTPSIDVRMEPLHAYFVRGFGFDPKSNDYKVLRVAVYEDSIEFPPRVELFKLRTGAWETVSFKDDFHYFISRRCSQTFVNGASHWFGYHSRSSVIVSFHMSDEKFQVMKYPNVLTGVRCDLISIVDFGGLLSLVQYVRSGHDNSCCIWLMKEYGVTESWTKQYTIDLRYWGGWRRSFFFRNKRELLIVTNSEELVLYDPETTAFIDLGISSYYFHGITTYIESLVLLDQVNAVPDY